MKFLDLFSGIGGFRIGMEMAGHECVGHVEWDKYAQASYIAMHNVKESEFIGWDITKVRAAELPASDVWCFGFPCQDISIAGNQKGFEGHRSSLFFTVTKLIRELEEKNRPSILFIENVKNLLSINGGFDFAKLLIELDEIGYDAEWQVLNSKNFGVPQNRERVFIVGHLRGRSGRKVFPICERSGEAVKQIGNISDGSSWENPQTGRVYSVDGISPCLNTCGGGQREPKIVVGQNGATDYRSRYAISPEGISPACLSRDYKGPIQVVVEGNVNPSGKRMNGNVFSSNGLAPTLTTNKGEGNKIAIHRQGLKVAIKEATKQGFAVATEGDSINFEQPNSKTRRGRVGKGVAQTLTTSCNQATLDGYRIRKLTPKECFRLQGFSDEYFERARAVNSDSQLYKQAGNSVTVNVIYEIAKRLGDD
jgi:DNA (cytosine-5)-methyltransferase 1